MSNFFSRGGQGHYDYRGKNQPTDTLLYASSEEESDRDWDNTLICWSTVEGYVSYRDRIEGSWLISALCKVRQFLIVLKWVQILQKQIKEYIIYILLQVFASKSCEMHLKDLLTAVDKEIKKKGGQTVEVSIRGFNKDLYFNPDLRRCTSKYCNEFGRNRGIETHERDGCGARMVPCISESCYKTMPLYNLLEHLHEYHENGYRVIYYMYLRVMANEAVAAKYSVDLEITTPNGLVSTKLSGVRVYSVDLPWEEVIEDRQLGRGVLAIHPYMATHYNCEEFSRAEGGRSFHTIYTVRYPC